MEKQIKLIKASMFFLLIFIFVLSEYKSAFSQIAIHGTVKSSIIQNPPVENAEIKLIGLNIIGSDTTKALIDSTRTDTDGNYYFHILSRVQDNNNLPQTFELSSNYPNPFSADTNFDLFVKKSGNYTISIYNILGQLVATNQRQLSLGSYSILWNGGYHPGVYFAIIQSETEKRSIKLIQLTKRQSFSKLNIANAPATKLSKKSPSYASSSTSHLQILVDKTYFENYKSSIFPYESRSLNVILNYIGDKQFVGPFELISTMAEDEVLTVATIDDEEILSLVWIEREDSVDLIAIVPEASPVGPITFKQALPTLPKANHIAAIILGLNSSEYSTEAHDESQPLLTARKGNKAGCDWIDDWFPQGGSCSDNGACCDAHDFCIDEYCNGPNDSGNILVCVAKRAAYFSCLKKGFLTPDECRAEFPMCSSECEKCHENAIECFNSPILHGESRCCSEGDCGKLQQCIILRDRPVVETNPCECKKHNLPSVDPCLTDHDPPPCNSCGDVHMRTPDGLAYDFQGAGEYLFITSFSGDIVVQTRQEPWGNSDVVSVNTAVAMNVSGDRVGIYLDRIHELYVNGIPTELQNEYFQLINGGYIYLLNNSSRKEYIIEWPSGFLTSVKFGSSYLDVGVSKPPTLQATYQGLAGDFNGLAEDDLLTRSGTPIVPPVTLNELYRIFGDSWRISDSESLFDYETGTSTQTFTLPDFPARSFTTQNLDPEDYEAAKQTCLAAGITDPFLLEDCILDVGATGETDFVDSAIDTKIPESDLEIENNGIVPTRGLIAYYPFNGNTNDESGYGNHGSVIGAKLGKDRFGNNNSAYSFDGINDYISINGVINDLVNISAYTVTGWAMPEELKNGRIFAINREPSIIYNQNIALLGWVEEGYFQLWFDTIEYIEFLATPSSIQNWHFFISKIQKHMVIYYKLIKKFC